MQCKKLSNNFRVVRPVPSALSSRISARPLVTFASYAARTLGSLPAQPPKVGSDRPRPHNPSSQLNGSVIIPSKSTRVSFLLKIHLDAGRKLCSTPRTSLLSRQTASRLGSRYFTIPPFHPPPAALPRSVPIHPYRSVVCERPIAANAAWLTTTGPLIQFCRRSRHVSLRYTTRESCPIGPIIHRERKPDSYCRTPELFDHAFRRFVTPISLARAIRPTTEHPCEALFSSRAP